MPREVLAWYEPLTPLSFLARIAYVMPDKTAVIHGGRSWTWQEFFSRVKRLSNALKGVGVKKGDKVAVLSRNLPPLLEGHYGIPLAGAAIVPINYRLSAPEISAIVNHSEAKVFIEEWRSEYNEVRTHSSLDYRPPAPEVVLTAATI